MTLNRSRRRLAIAGVAVAAALGAAGTAQAEPSAEHCAERQTKLYEQFRDMEERHGWETAADWWQARWHAYYQSCVI